MTPTSQYLSAALELLRARITDMRTHAAKTDIIHFAGRRSTLIESLNHQWDAVTDRVGVPPPDEVVTWL
jgi:hypothetical protein